MPDVVAGAFKPVLHPERRECREPAVHGDHRQTVPGNTVVRVASDGTAYAAAGPQMRSPSCAPPDAAYAPGSNLSDAKHEQETPPA